MTDRDGIASIYDDERLYTVKEVTKITGVSEKSLRYYDDIGLLEPYTRGGDNNYRYYTINQFYLLELFKVAKRLGLSVPEYREMLFEAGDVEAHEVERVRTVLDGLLQKRRQERDRLDLIINELQSKREELDELSGHRIDEGPFFRVLPQRCVYFVDHDPASEFEETSVRMRSTRNQYREYLTENYGLLLDIAAAREGRMVITRQYVVLDCDIPDSECIMHLPSGTYASFLYHAMRRDEQMTHLAAWLADNPTDSAFLVADELGFYNAVANIVHAVGVPV